MTKVAERTIVRGNYSRATSVASVVVVIGALVAWYIVAPRYVSELVFPSPQAVVSAAWKLGPNLLNHALVTLMRVIAGWVAGAIAGIATGLAMTRSKTFYALSHPFIEAIRPLPTVVLIPFFILWFGIGSFGQILLIFIGSFMTLTIHTYVAVHSIPLELIRAAVSLGATAGQVYRRIVLPNLLPGFKSAFQISAALSFAVGIAAEFMGAQSGLGFLVMVARRTLNTDVILLGTIIIGVEAFLVDVCVRRLFDALCPWAEPPVNSLRQFARTAWRWSL